MICRLIIIFYSVRILKLNVSQLLWFGDSKRMLSKDQIEIAYKSSFNYIVQGRLHYNSHVSVIIKKMNSLILIVFRLLESLALELRMKPLMVTAEYMSQAEGSQGQNLSSVHSRWRERQCLC